MPNIELKDLILVVAILVAFIVACVVIYAFIRFKKMMTPPLEEQSQM